MEKSLIEIFKYGCKCHSFTMETPTETKQEELNSQNDTTKPSVEPDGTLKLGGNIELKGFNEVEPAQLVVVKKMVGSYVRKITDSGTTPDKVTVAKEGDKCSIAVRIENKEVVTEETDPNVFFCLDKVLAEVLKQI